MPKVKYKEFREKLKRVTIFSFRAVESKMGKNYAKLFVYNLKKAGEITELMKGWYSFRNSPYLLTVPLGEAYIGLGTAAFLYNVWDQVPNTDIITTRAPRKIKTGERKIGDRKLIIRSINKKMYFGYETKYIEEAKEKIRISDPEKTLIDLIYFNYSFLDEIAPELIKIIDKKKLNRYLKRMENVRGIKKIRKNINRIFRKASSE
ncbi:MAG: hypothetical protein ISS36_02305 [Candidatus Aenigmarchaeota archaeon]|nr:hypothetical protein [Candidatus Aenigmarchaeota archaeon]